jgi:hypothetical protein
MIAGTKNWTLSPPVDWRTLKPTCNSNGQGGLCWANVQHPDAPKPGAETQTIAKTNPLFNVMLYEGESL